MPIITTPTFRHPAQPLFRACIVAIIAVAVFVLGLPDQARATVETVRASHTYVLGDTDTPNEARKVCFIQAKRKALEQAGTYVEAVSEARGHRLTRDEVRSYAAAVLKARCVEESMDVVDGRVAVTQTVEVQVDPDELGQRLKALRDSVRARAELLEVQAEQYGLEDRLLQGAAPAMAPDTGVDVVKDGKLVDPVKYQGGDWLAASEDVLKLERRQQAVIAGLTLTSRQAPAYLEKGMTREAVASRLGQPASAASSNRYTCAQYGQVWAVFQGQNLRCARKRLDRGQCSCAGFGQDFILR